MYNTKARGRNLIVKEAINGNNLNKAEFPKFFYDFPREINYKPYDE